MDKQLIYNSCSEIPIKNFFDLLDTGDLARMYKNTEDVGKIEEDKVFNVFSNIMLEYHELTKNEKVIKQQFDAFNLEYLEARYHTTLQLLDMYEKTKDIEIFLILKDLDWKVDENKSVVEELAKVVKGLKGLKNKINIAKLNFKKKYQKKSNAPTNFDLEAQLIELEVGIPLSYKIDPNVDSISRYVKLIDILNKKNKALSNGKV